MISVFIPGMMNNFIAEKEHLKSRGARDICHLFVDEVSYKLYNEITIQTPTQSEENTSIIF
jgi:hypothetical protein